jgi:BirA family biotin operon repressor/biotin-[acetyl-CoA-carboxylase] ligase
MLSKERIEEKLAELSITSPKIFFYDETDSTNTRAIEHAKAAQSKENAVFIANCQSAGRGRRGRDFVSNKGAGIYISLLTFPKENGAEATHATARAAVCTARAIEALCPCNIQIKWVNDLYLGGKKLAGILTEGEMTSDGRVAYQVVGIGINVYKSAISDEISSIATSLEEENGLTPDRSALVAQIIKEFMCADGNCYHEYKSRSLVIGKKVTVLKLNESYEATALDINEDFSLLVDRDGKAERLFTGEISLKI